MKDVVYTKEDREEIYNEIAEMARELSYEIQMHDISVVTDQSELQCLIDKKMKELLGFK